MPPHSVQPGSNSPPPSFRYSSTEYIIIFVSETDERSWPTSPAEWNVEPLVSWRGRAARRRASRARRGGRRSTCPPTPPPMITQRALAGRSRLIATGVLQPGREARIGQRRPPRGSGARPRRRRSRSRARRSRSARRPTSPSRKSDMIRISRSAAKRRGVHGSPPVGGQQPLVVGLVEAVVDRQVAEVEVAVAHARVLPVDDPHAARRRAGSSRSAGRCGTAPARARDRSARRGSRCAPAASSSKPAGTATPPARAVAVVRRRSRTSRSATAAAGRSWNARSAAATSASSAGSRSSSAVERRGPR